MLTKWSRTRLPASDWVTTIHHCQSWVTMQQQCTWVTIFLCKICSITRLLFYFGWHIPCVLLGDHCDLVVMLFRVTQPPFSVGWHIMTISLWPHYDGFNFCTIWMPYSVPPFHTQVVTATLQAPTTLSSTEFAARSTQYLQKMWSPSLLSSMLSPESRLPVKVLSSSGANIPSRLFSSAHCTS